MKNRLQHRSWVSRVRLVLAKVALALPVALMTTLVANPSAQAQTFTVLYSFTGGADGSFPNGLLRDAAGNLYGTAQGGGASNLGTVFKLDRSGQYKVLHSFTGADGVSPVAGLIRDAAGNLYGTTYQGGASGLGVVFKLDRTRTETALHSFTGGADGRNPAAALILDAAGNLYGTTTNGGDSDLGTVFKLDVTGKETVLHSFTGGTDGAVPYADLIRDAAGNLYGTTSVGGSSGCFGVGCGTVFKLDTTGRETVLYSFSGGTDGHRPTQV